MITTVRDLKVALEDKDDNLPVYVVYENDNIIEDGDSIKDVAAITGSLQTDDNVVIILEE